MSKISFLIPALNEASNIKSCIESIKTNATAINSPEIIVGDHGSSDKTVEIAENAGATVYHYTRGTTIASLRNFLVSKSQGDILVFVDADVHLTTMWGEHISQTISDLESDPLQITGSWCSPPESTSIFINSWFGIMPKENRTYLGTGHIIFTKILFEEIDGFNELLKTGEDYDFCYRAKSFGKSLIKSNELLKVIHHDYPTTCLSFIKRERWHGTGDFQSIRNIIQSKIALITLLFVALHFLFLTSLLTRKIYTAPSLAGIFILLAFMSIYKFHKVDFKTRAHTIGIYYLYFIGRSLSLLTQLPDLLTRKRNHKK